MTQFHFTSWPDHGVPEYAGPILNYLCRMKAQMKVSRGPTLVHCRSAIGVLVRVSALKVCVGTFSLKWIVSPFSAGIGRTGTLIATDTTLEQAAQENVVDIPAIVTKMRRQRMKMVQNSVRVSCNWHIFYCKCPTSPTNYKQLSSYSCYHCSTQNDTHFAMLHSTEPLPMMTPHHLPNQLAVWYWSNS